MTMKRNRKKESKDKEAEREKSVQSSLGGLAVLELALCKVTKR